MQIDLHSISLKDAKNIIDTNIEFCIKNNISTLEIIHGFNNGSKIKNYLNNSKSLKEKYPEIKDIQSNLINNGKTTIYFKLKLKGNN